VGVLDLGGVGSVISLVSYNNASQSASIGVGTSAYLMVGLLLWIGSMIAELTDADIKRLLAVWYFECPSRSETHVRLAVSRTLARWPI
jgi:hypothetical protein